MTDAVVDKRPVGAPLPNASNLTFRSPRVVMAGLLASLTPLALLISNRDWIFTPEAFLDPWNYVGFFREYLNPDFAPGAYKLARLPWILAGFLAHHLFSPVPAAYVLHGGFLILSSLALFAGLYALLGRVSLAGVVATMLGFYTHAHGSGGWDYHNTAAGAFYLLAFMSLALPGTTSGRRIPLTLAGAMAALAIHSNITFVNFLPALIFVHLQTVRVRDGQLPSIRSLLTRAAWGTLGAVLITAALGLINMMAGREFLFFKVLAGITARYVADPRYSAGWRMAPGWELTAMHLALPAAVFVLGILSVVMKWRTSKEGTALIAHAFVLQFLAMSLVWVGWEADGQLALSWNYFAYVLIPSTFIAIGGLLAGGWPDWCERYWGAPILLTAVAATLCLGGVADPYLQTVVSPMRAQIAVFGCVLFIAGLGPFVLRPAFTTTLVVIGVFAIGNRLMASNAIDYMAQDSCKVQQDVYAAVVHGASEIGAFDETYTRVQTWFDQLEQIHPTEKCSVNLAWVASAMAQTALIPYVAPPWPAMPAVDAIPDSAIQKMAGTGALLAIVTAKQQNIDAWNRRLGRMNIEHREVASRRVRLGDSEFSIHAWEVYERAPSVDFDAPIIAITDQTPGLLNVYGTPKGTVVKEPSGVVFKTTDARDHLAYPFAMFGARANDTWLKVSVEFPTSRTNSGSCVIGVQDPKLAMVATIPCRSTTRYVKLPAQTPGLRVYFNDSRSRPIVVPTHLEVALSK